MAPRAQRSPAQVSVGLLPPVGTRRRGSAGRGTAPAAARGPWAFKNYPSSFEKTDLDARLKGLGVKNLVLAGFMTHMCVNSTARAAFNHGYGTTVVANATATRALPGPAGRLLPAQVVQEAALAFLGDLAAVVVGQERDIAN